MVSTYQLKSWLTNFSTDVDECVNGNNNCDENTDCINTEGSYICMCSSGFSGNGTSCNGTLSTSSKTWHNVLRIISLQISMSVIILL